jgi:hypothetical protein
MWLSLMEIRTWPSHEIASRKIMHNHKAWSLSWGRILLETWILNFSYVAFVKLQKWYVLRLSKKKTQWPESASELYRPSDRRFSAKLMPTFAVRECHVVSSTDPCCRIIGFLYRSRYFFFQIAPQLYSRGWVDAVPDSLLVKKSGSAGNRTRTSRYVARTMWHPLSANLALTSPTSGSRSAGIFRSPTETTEFVLLFVSHD